MKKISSVRSGSTWAWDRNPTTLRPVSLLDRVLVTVSQHALEVLAHVDDAAGLAAVHDRLLQGVKPLPRITTTMNVVQRVGLGLHRATTVVLPQNSDDRRRNRRQ
jgi:hypothetical protein